MSEFTVHALLETSSVAVEDVYCRGSCRHQGAEECAGTTQLVFPNRGIYVRHVGRDEAVAEANQACSSTPARPIGSAIPCPAAMPA